MYNAFSDGNPAYEFFVFVVLSCTFMALATRPAVKRGAAAVQSAVAGFVRSRGALPEHGLVADLRKLDAVRIAAGSLAAFHYGEIAWTGGLYGDGVPSAAVLAAGLAVLVAAGLFTPAAALALMASGSILVDNALGASTLGTQVMSMILLILALAPAGRTLSLDAALARAKGPGTVIRALHRGMGRPCEDRLLVAKLLALSAYFCVCLYSAFWHLHDSAWTSGLVIAWVLLSPLHDPHWHDAAARIYEWSPFALVNLSRLATAGMLAWYFLVLPGLFLGRAPRAFARYWGLAFILISLFVLPLSGFLAQYELLLWFALFAPAWLLPTPSRAFVVLSGGRRKLRGAAVRALSAAGVLHGLAFRPYPDPQRQQVIASADGPQDRAGVKVGTGRCGPGSGLYGLHARRLVPLRPARVTALPAAVVMSFAVLAAAFVVRLPVGPDDPDRSLIGAWSRHVFGTAPLAVGIGKINVFNAADLALSRRLINVYAVQASAAATDPERGGRVRKPEFFRAASDAEKFWITAHARADSRQNVGCSRAFFAASASRIGVVARRAGLAESKLAVEIVSVRVPSEAELESYRFVPRTEAPVCEALLDLRRGDLERLSYREAGVAQVLAEQGYEPVLAGGGMEAALAYPCRLDASLIGAIFDSHEKLGGDEDLLRAVRALFEDRPGRFTVDCLMGVRDLTNRWPEIASIAFVNPTPANCAAGETLLAALRELPGLPAIVAEHLRDRHVRAIRAGAEGAWRACLGAALEGRAAVWAHLLKPFPAR